MEMTKEQVTKKTVEILSAHLGVKESAVAANLDQNLIDDLHADSLDSVELILAFEEAFQVEIPDSDAESILTPRHAIDFVCNKLKITQ